MRKRLELSVQVAVTEGGGSEVLVVSYGFKPRNGSEARSIGYEKETSPTLNNDADCGVGVLMVNDGMGNGIRTSKLRNNEGGGVRA